MKTTALYTPSGKWVIFQYDPTSRKAKAIFAQTMKEAIEKLTIKENNHD